MSQRNGKHYFWSNEQEDQLIDFYEAYTFLYDGREEGYNDRDMRWRAYEQIGKKLGVPAEEVNRRLRSIRTAFTRDLQKSSQSGPKFGRIGIPHATAKIRKLRHRLKFLIPHVRPRPGARVRLGKKKTVRRTDAISPVINIKQETMDDLEEDSYNVAESTSRDTYDNDPYDEPQNKPTGMADVFPTGSSESEVDLGSTSVADKSSVINAVSGLFMTQPDFDSPSEKVYLPERMSHMNAVPVRNTYIQETDDEEGLWCKYLAKKLRRISSQELKEDLMLHVDGLVNKALRKKWSMPDGEGDNVNVRIGKLDKDEPTDESSRASTEASKDVVNPGTSQIE